MKPVLIAKTLSEWHHRVLRDSSFSYEHVEPLTFEYTYDRDLLSQQLYDAQDIALTSSKCIEALKLIDEERRGTKRLYIVGERTAGMVRDMGFQEIASAPDSDTLASQVRWQHAKPVVYLCGNLRRDVLIDYWTRHKIPFEETIIYRTRLSYPIINAGKYGAILFFSPSGVSSITKGNSIPRDLPVGSIGPSTTRSLINLGFLNILEAPGRSFISLINTVADTL